MNEHEFDRVAKAYLADGPTVVADRVLDAAFAEVHLTRQRRALMRAPWRVALMNSFAKVAVAAVAVLAIGVLSLSALGPGIGGPPAATPSPSVVATPTPTAEPTPEPTATPSPEPPTPPLTGRFTSPSHGYTIAFPEGWRTRAATAPWTANVVDYFNPGSDLLMPESPGNQFLALASQPLGDRTPAEWEAEVWQITIDDDPGAQECPAAAEPITIDGARGVLACDTAIVTDSGRGYVVRLWTSGDEPVGAALYDTAWLRSVLATMVLDPEGAVDAS